MMFRIDLEKYDLRVMNLDDSCKNVTIRIVVIFESLIVTKH